MNINPITPINTSITPIAPLTIAESTAAGADGIGGAGSSATSFGGAVRGAVEALDGQQKAVEAEMARAVTGESPDLHRTIAELQSADLSFQLALQVRNKLIGAYDEVMRMQV